MSNMFAILVRKQTYNTHIKECIGVIHKVLPEKIHRLNLHALK